MKQCVWGGGGMLICEDACYSTAYITDDNGLVKTDEIFMYSAKIKAMLFELTCWSMLCVMNTILSKTSQVLISGN